MKAELADGRILEFPDGTDPAVIQQTVKRLIAQGGGATSQPQQAQPPVGTPSPIPAAPLSGAGPDGSDLQWYQPGYQEAIAPKQAPTDLSRKGILWPVSYDEKGDRSLDTDAGIVGALKRAFMAPGDVKTGKLDPMSQEGLDRALEAAMIMTPAGAAARVGLSLISPRGAYKTVTPKAPTREALREATNAGYKQMRDMGVEIKSQAVASWADDLARQLEGKAIIEESHPELFALVNKLKSPPSGESFVRVEVLEEVYKQLGKIGGSLEPAKASAANQAQRSLDNFLETLDPSAVVAGTATPQQAAKVIKDARGNAAAGFRSDRITQLETTSARRTAAANSGRNADNNIRQRLTSLIESKKKSRGLNAEEKAAIDDIIFGRPTKRAARLFGNLLGGGGGLGSSLLAATGAAGGAYAIGPVGAALGLIPPILGAASRGVANRMSRKELKALDDLIRSRSPLAGSVGGLRYIPDGTRDTMLKALAAGAIGPVHKNDMQDALGAK